jgi:agmatine deiminase
MLAPLLLTSLLAVPAPQAAAEFDPQRAVWMSWPTYEHKKGVSVERTTIAIVRELLRNVNVEMLVPSDRVAARVRRLFPSKRLSLRKLDYSEIWMRDFGPSFLTDGQRKTVLDFGFNYWGYETPDQPSSRQHGAIDRSIAKSLRVATRTAGLIGEGGDREANGDGVAMLCEAVERQRNPGLTLAQIDEKVRTVLGVQKVIWLKQGVVEDGLFFAGPIAGNVYLPATTGGHMDNIARFADRRTIVAAEVTAAEAAQNPIAKENRRRLEANYQVLAAATDAHGQKFRIVRMPAPDLHLETMGPGDPMYDFLADVKYRPAHRFPKGKPVKFAHAASYLNFLITNGLVLTSKLYRPGAPLALKRKDAESLAILRKLFPGRRAVAIPTRSINLGGGGIHCITAHEPKVADQPLPPSTAIQ